MRRPTYRGTSDRTGSTFFCLYVNLCVMSIETVLGVNGHRIKV